MQMLDSTISNVAIPTISGFLGASTDEGTWVITSFGVANAIAIPVTGRLAQRIGELRLFLLLLRKELVEEKIIEPNEPFKATKGLIATF